MPPPSRTLAGSALAIGGADRTVALHNLAGDRVVRDIASHPATIRQLAFSPDGQVLATITADDPLVRFWEVESGELLASLAGHLEAPNALAYSPDGQTLATGGPDGDVMLWPTDPERAIARLCDALRDGSSPDQPVHSLCR